MNLDPPPGFTLLHHEMAIISGVVGSSIAGFETTRFVGQPGPKPVDTSGSKVSVTLALIVRETGIADDSSTWEGIVHETGMANDSPASAQNLPAATVNRVIGHVSGDDRVDMFRIAIAPDTENVSIVLKPLSPTDYLQGRGSSCSTRRAASCTTGRSPQTDRRSGDDGQYSTGKGDVTIVLDRRDSGRPTRVQSAECVDPRSL